ncbi:MAG TPA: tripartite tricarboxylate transporter permease [Clostridia bacterium]|nr:tripartite tricarboxylate transporter permease [Clostridia bacterium]
MDTIGLLIQGFSVALQPSNLLFCVIGVVVGTLVGALPGLGPTGATAMLLPMTYKLDPAGALIMLAGIYYGTQYGGALTSIVAGVPGESAAVMTAIDGYKLAQQGKAGKALGIAAVCSFAGGTLSVIGLMFFGPALAKGALLFGPTETFAVMLMSFSLITSFSGKSAIRGFISMVIGLMLALVGQDIITGVPRMTFGMFELYEGIDFLPVGLGIFGLSEAMKSFEEGEVVDLSNANLHWRDVLPNWADIKRCIPTTIRGSILGFFVGVLPGLGATIASFMAYGVEKKVSKHPETFGEGEIQGIAAPEAANNASTGGAMIPMFSLGIPGGTTTAVLLGALMMFGLRPGPRIFSESSSIVWGMIASMYLGNVMLVLINVGCIPWLCKAIKKASPYMLIIILLLSIYGVHSLRNNVVDLTIMLISAFAGYFMDKMDIPKAPLMLALLLGSKLEQSFRLSLTLSNGSFGIFFGSTTSKVCMIFTMISVIWSIIGAVRTKREVKEV